MTDTKDRREFLESLGIKTDGFHGIVRQYTEIHEHIITRSTSGEWTQDKYNACRPLVDEVSEMRDMLAACFFCIRKQQEQIAELKERLK